MEKTTKNTKSHPTGPINFRRRLILPICLLICSIPLIFISNFVDISIPGFTRIFVNLLALAGPAMAVASFILLCTPDLLLSRNKSIQYLFYFYLIAGIILIIYSLGLTHIFNIDSLPIYSVFIISGVAAGIFLCIKNSDYLNFSKKEKLVLLSYILLGAIIGAKYYTFLATMNLQGRIFDLFSSGLSAYGGAIGALLMFFIFSRQFDKRYLDLIYILSPAIPLMYSIGKIGCSIVGCCHGVEYDGVFHVAYGATSPAPTGVNLFPVQFSETIVFFLIFLFVQFYCLRNRKNPKFTVGLAMILCGLAKFLLEFLRMSHKGTIISSTQAVSLTFIIIGAVILFSAYRQRKTNGSNV